MFRKKSVVNNTIDTLIGAETRLEGNIVFQGGLRIDGHVRGDVVASSDAPTLLVIGEHASVEGDVVAARLIVNGRLAGVCTIGGEVEVQAKAHIRGTLRYRSIEIQRGAVVEASLEAVDGESSRPGLKLASPPRPADVDPPLLGRASKPRS